MKTLKIQKRIYEERIHCQNKTKESDIHLEPLCPKVAGSHLWLNN